MKKKITLPDNLTPLYELSMNLWFSWNPEVRDLYREMDLPLWRKVGRNPTEFLKNLKQDKTNLLLIKHSWKNLEKHTIVLTII